MAQAITYPMYWITITITVWEKFIALFKSIANSPIIAHALI